LEVEVDVATRAKRPPIARQLQIAEKTSKVHVSHILSKLGMQSRTQAALYPARIGLVASASRQEQPIARAHRAAAASGRPGASWVRAESGAH
jgi:hypothetical protein